MKGEISVNKDLTTEESLLGEVEPSKAIKLAVSATLALLAKAVHNIVDTCTYRFARF